MFLCEQLFFHDQVITYVQEVGVIGVYGVVVQNLVVVELHNEQEHVLQRGKLKYPLVVLEIVWKQKSAMPMTALVSFEDIMGGGDQVMKSKTIRRLHRICS